MDEIKELKREGLSIRAICRLTGYDGKTISRFLLAPTGRPVYGPRPAPSSKLEPFKPYLKERLKAGVWNAQVLMRELLDRRLQTSILPPRFSSSTRWDICHWMISAQTIFFPLVSACYERGSIILTSNRGPRGQVFVRGVIKQKLMANEVRS